MAQKEKPITAYKEASRSKVVRRAIESASEFNLFLNRQRQLERSVYMDSQTDTVNYPVGLGRHNKTLTKTNKIGRYPIAVMPNQYQDWYIEYTPQELDFLPVDTVLKGPIMSIDKLPPVLKTPDVSDFEDSDDDSCSSTSENCYCSSCCSSQDEMEVQAEGQESSTSDTVPKAQAKSKASKNSTDNHQTNGHGKAG